STSVKVTRLDTYFLSAPLPQPVSTSTHRITSVSEVVVKLTTDAGPVGIGEAHGPFLFQQGPDGLRTVSDIITAITPLVVGQDPFDAERIWQDLFALTYTSVRGIPTLARQQRPLVTPIRAGTCRPRCARRRCARRTTSSGSRTRCPGTTSGARWSG